MDRLGMAGNSDEGNNHEMKALKIAKRAMSLFIQNAKFIKKIRPPLNFFYFRRIACTIAPVITHAS
jgi:hypothetical protein